MTGLISLYEVIREIDATPFDFKAIPGSDGSEVIT